MIKLDRGVSQEFISALNENKEAMALALIATKGVWDSEQMRVEKLIELFKREREGRLIK